MQNSNERKAKKLSDLPKTHPAHNIFATHILPHVPDIMDILCSIEEEGPKSQNSATPPKAVSPRGQAREQLREETRAEPNAKRPAPGVQAAFKNNY